MFKSSYFSPKKNFRVNFPQNFSTFISGFWPPVLGKNPKPENPFGPQFGPKKFFEAIKEKILWIFYILGFFPMLKYVFQSLLIYLGRGKSPQKEDSHQKKIFYGLKASNLFEPWSQKKIFLFRVSAPENFFRSFKSNHKFKIFTAHLMHPKICVEFFN